MPEETIIKEGPLSPYDGILLLSFGGPEGPDEVLPFLRRVTAGRDIPDERLAQVGAHYALVGGRSPINDANRALLRALRDQLDRRGIDLPVFWGNRNAAPFLTEALRDAHEQGCRHLVTITTSAYSSYSSCRQYRENIADALAQLAGEGRALRIDKIGPYAGRAAFVEANARVVRDAVAGLTGLADAELVLVFVTHSIPTAMDDTSGPSAGSGGVYTRQHQAVAEGVTGLVSTQLGRSLMAELVFCSRSGPPTQRWLEPDINDRLAELAEAGVKHVVVIPAGFLSDHMEVVYDLDTEARATAARLGLGFTRVPTVGGDEGFVAGLADLLVARAAEARGEEAEPAPDRSPEVLTMPVFTMPSTCAPGCCVNLRGARPNACGSDEAET